MTNIRTNNSIVALGISSRIESKHGCQAKVLARACSKFLWVLFLISRKTSSFRNSQANLAKAQTHEVPRKWQTDLTSNGRSGIEQRHCGEDMLPRISLFLTFMPQRQECYQIEPPPNIVFDASRSNIHFYSTPGGGLQRTCLNCTKSKDIGGPFSLHLSISSLPFPRLTIVDGLKQSENKSPWSYGNTQLGVQAWYFHILPVSWGQLANCQWTNLRLLPWRLVASEAGVAPSSPREAMFRQIQTDSKTEIEASKVQDDVFAWTELSNWRQLGKIMNDNMDPTAACRHNWATSRPVFGQVLA